MRWVIPDKLARSSRPGYSGEELLPVGASEVEAWIEEARHRGIKSIVCLLSGTELSCYASLDRGLLAYYRASGFDVAHIPVKDHQHPPIPNHQLREVKEAYLRLRKPLLVHCSAGVDRTGYAVEYLHRVSDSVKGLEKS